MGLIKGDTRSIDSSSCVFVADLKALLPERTRVHLLTADLLQKHTFMMCGIRLLDRICARSWSAMEWLLPCFREEVGRWCRGGEL